MLNIASLKVYNDPYLWKYILSFNTCFECNEEFIPSEVVMGECKNCIVKAWTAFGYY